MSREPRLCLPDHETALSAVRNLNGQELGGRPLRIDLADSDPFLEGKTTVRGELIDGGETRAQWRERERDHRGGRSPSRDANAFLSSLPPGVPVPLGSTALDTISQMLATANPGQILEVLAQMKAFVITHPEQARALLIAHPQLGYALFQALLLNKIVDPAVLQRMLAATSASGPAAPPQQPSAHPPLYPSAPPVQHQAPFVPPPMAMPPAPVHHAPPPVHTPNMYQQQHAPPPHMQQAPPPPYYRAPPPAQPQPVPQAPPAPQPEFNPAQRDMLMQVLSLTPEQINSLPPTERDQIQQCASSSWAASPHEGDV
ncbi:hinge domain of cleavage stimulation factor subunit 2-domain-containing protein [Amylocystis lapponica]|nr:hinge domain of cleavage stimulation factor subunit 2-domain-containing protein [Amylocystis lapponica]